VALLQLSRSRISDAGHPPYTPASSPMLLPHATPATSSSNACTIDCSKYYSPEAGRHQRFWLAGPPRCRAPRHGCPPARSAESACGVVNTCTLCR
jgi:hypothetical protein